MTVTRRTVLERLAAASGAARRETTTVEALVSALDADERTVEEHLTVLEACGLARTGSDGRARVTSTGEELLALETDGVIIVDAATPCPDR